MKASEQVGGKWVSVCLPTDPGELDKWLSANDGKDVVIADEETMRYYCGSMRLINGYLAKGLDADSFYPLAKQLWQATQTKSKDEREDTPDEYQK